MLFLGQLSITARLIVIQPDYPGINKLLAEIIQQPNVAYVHSADMDEIEPADIEGIEYLLIYDADKFASDMLHDYLVQLSPKLRVILIPRDSLPQISPNLTTDVFLFPVGTVEIDQHYLQIIAFGQQQIIIDGEVLDFKPRNPQNLVMPKIVYYLAEKGSATAVDIITACSEDSTSAQTFHAHRTRLNQLVGFELIVRQPHQSTYHFAPNVQVQYDVKDYLSLLRKDTPESYQEAQDLYHGDYLPTWHTDWIVERRTRLQQIQASALLQHTHNLLDVDTPDAALATLMRAFNYDCGNPTIMTLALKLHLQLDQPCQALDLYKRFLAHNMKSNTPVPEIENLVTIARQRC